KAEEVAQKVATKKKKKEAVVAEETVEENEYIEFEDFMKVKLLAGRIVEAQKHPNADRLLHFQVDVGEERPRSICAGIANKYAPEDMVGKQVVIVANLKPRKLRGVMSEGMMLAAGDAEIEGLVTFDQEIVPGGTVR
ncbi:MAG: methionine--tRNA ligase subunit beta, partial [Myxococcota bacterium]